MEASEEDPEDTDACRLCLHKPTHLLEHFCYLILTEEVWGTDASLDEKQSSWVGVLLQAQQSLRGGILGDVFARAPDIRNHLALSQQQPQPCSYQIQHRA